MTLRPMRRRRSRWQAPRRGRGEPSERSSPGPLPSRRLARRGRTEFDREPDILGWIVGVGTKEPPCSLGYQLHSLTARTCAIDDQPANEIGRLQSDFLHDHAADREAK